MPSTLVHAVNNDNEIRIKKPLKLLAPSNAIAVGVTVAGENTPLA